MLLKKKKEKKRQEKQTAPPEDVALLFQSSMSRKFANKIPHHDRLIIRKIRKIEADVLNSRGERFSRDPKATGISEPIVSTKWLA